MIDLDGYFAVREPPQAVTNDKQMLHTRKLRNRDTNLEPPDNAIVIDLDGAS